MFILLLYYRRPWRDVDTFVYLIYYAFRRISLAYAAPACLASLICIVQHRSAVSRSRVGSGTIYLFIYLYLYIHVVCLTTLFIMLPAVLLRWLLLISLAVSLPYSQRELVLLVKSPRVRRALPIFRRKVLQSTCVYSPRYSLAGRHTSHRCSLCRVNYYFSR